MLYSQTSLYGHPLIMDTSLLWTPRYYGQFALSLGKESPYIFSIINSTVLIWITH